MRVADLNWMQLEEYLRSDDRVVLPLGSTEQHPYGITPYFAAFPGSPSVKPDTYLAFVGELLDSLRGQGFTRFLLVNAHGGNKPVEALARPHVVVHDWWEAPKTQAVVREIDPDGRTRRGRRTFRGRDLPVWSYRTERSRPRRASRTTPVRCVPAPARDRSAVTGTAPTKT